MKTEKTGNYEVSSDGETVWVNGIVGCVARFGPTGYDWNNGDTVGAAKGSETFGFSTRRQTNTKDWKSFVGMVEEMFEIALSDSHRPTRLS